MGRIKIREVKENDRESRIQQATQERTTKGTNLRNLAILYNLPRSTLSDKLRGIPPRHEAQKKQQALSPAIERSLVRWIDDIDASDFPPRLDLFKAVPARLVSDDGGPPLGITWLRRFLNRYLEHSTKFSSGLNRQRALSSKLEPIKDYRKLQTLLRKYKFLPHNIYSMDEKAFLLGLSNRAKVIVRRGRQPARETQDGSRGWITVVETCCANNTMLPLMVIFQGKGLYRGWFDADGDYADRTVIFAHSDKGFTNELATQWLSYFDTWTRDVADGQQRLFILDGYRTHYSLDFIRYAVQNKITLLSYPGYTTRLMQPLDVGLFAPLQKAYGTAVHTHTRETRTCITKKLFFCFYSQAKWIAYTRANIRAAWRAAGIQPYNPDAVLQPLL